MHYQAEAIDDYMTDCMIKAENSFKMLNTKDFSPKKNKRLDHEKFWRMAEQAARENEQTPMTWMLAVITKYPNKKFSHMDSTENIQQQLKICHKNNHQAKDNSKELRQCFLAKQAEIKRLNGNITAEAAILQLKHIKASVNVYKSLRQVMNPSEYCACLSMILSMIKVPTEDGTFITIVNPKDIEEILLEQNWQHYGQADQTEMASEQMREAMGPLGTSNFCDKVLGNADLSAMSSSLQAIFQQCTNQRINIVP
jgi:hypothetical protein